MKKTACGENEETVEVDIRIMKDTNVIIFGPETKVEINRARMSWANQITRTS